MKEDIDIEQTDREVKLRKTLQIPSNTHTYLEFRGDFEEEELEDVYDILLIQEPLPPEEVAEMVYFGEIDKSKAKEFVEKLNQLIKEYLR